MNIKNIFTASVIILIFLLKLSCELRNNNFSVDEGEVRNSIYTSHEIGWTIEIPKGWETTKKSEMESFTESGLEAIEENHPDYYSTTDLKYLIGFQKNKANYFQSLSEYTGSDNVNEWKKLYLSQKKMQDLILSKEKYKSDSSEVKTEIIDGLEFEMFVVRIYSPEGDVVYTQLSYSRLINGFDFGVVIGYNNESYKNEMLMAFTNSRFRNQIREDTHDNKLK